MSDVLLVGTPSSSLGQLDAVIVGNDADWSVRKISTADAALRQLELRPADVVVAALGDDAGVYKQFFAEAASVSPRTLRFALFDASSVLPDKVMNAHQVMAARKDMRHVLPMLAAASEVAERADALTLARPVISEDRELHIPQGRHLVVEQVLDGAFDVGLDLPRP